MAGKDVEWSKNTCSVIRERGREKLHGQIVQQFNKNGSQCALARNLGISLATIDIISSDNSENLGKSLNVKEHHETWAHAHGPNFLERVAGIQFRMTKKNK